MIISMGKELKLGLMEVNTKDFTNKERKMVKVNTHGKMEAFLLECGKITRLMDMVFIIGQMEDSIRETG